MIKCEGCQREPGEYESYAYGDAAPTKWLALVKQMRDSDNHSVLGHMRVFCSEECVRAFYNGQRIVPPPRPNRSLMEE